MDDKRLAHAKKLRRAIELLVQATPLAEDDALEIAELYEAWVECKTYATGHTVRYGTDDTGAAQLYSVIQAHTAQSNWTPDTTPSLYKPLGFDAGYPIWTQPLGASDAYAKGDTVSHIGKLWVSSVASNVWEPGVYGWDEFK